MVVTIPRGKDGTDRALTIEAWRREYNEERPKRSLGGLTPETYARQLAAKAKTSTPDSKAGRY
ncbi:integrase core domain-containing protein [Burkholderia gladioli]|uniref:integrase core domain-containing protein n=1 Tax=Burkholderia gladioli TaxID=28095 RepID=UPI003C7B0472